jgi:hypothetical protein
MEHFCTLFDSSFLPQGFALYNSLKRHAGNFMLWVLCMDEEVEVAFQKFAFPEVCCIALKDIETQALKSIKSIRSRGEYCWTLTPFLPKAVMDRDTSITRVTYVDADCWFINDPKKILQEMDDAKKDVLITPHAYAKKYDQSKTSGIYCVQFVPFRRTAAALEILSWWQEKCIDWCYAKLDNGRFGDQMYLDSWPIMFSKKVHVLNNAPSTIAPWNAKLYENITDFKKIGCLYHFHALRIFNNNKVLLNAVYSIPTNVLKQIYAPYLKELKAAILLGQENKISFRFSTFPHKGLLGYLRRIKNRMSIVSF